MKVTDRSEIERLPPSASVETPTSRPGAAERSETEDRVSTDDSARVAAAIAETSKVAAGGRAAKLEAIAAAVRAGTYRPDPERIAQEILEDAELAAKLQALFRR